MEKVMTVHSGTQVSLWVDMAEQDRMFFAMVDRIHPDKEYIDEEDSLFSRPKTFFHGLFPIQKYRTRGFSVRDADRSTIVSGESWIVWNGNVNNLKKSIRARNYVSFNFLD